MIKTLFTFYCKTRKNVKPLIELVDNRAVDNKEFINDFTPHAAAANAVQVTTSLCSAVIGGVKMIA